MKSRPQRCRRRFPISWPRPAQRLRLEQLEGRWAPAVVTVTTAADDLTPNDGSVSLREAMTAVNAGNDLGDPDITAHTTGTFGTGDQIKFSIGAANSLAQINVGSTGLGALPAIVKPVLIDGHSQGHGIYNRTVILDGSQAGFGADGFDVRSTGVTVQGLGIQDFTSGAGVRIEANSGVPAGQVAVTLQGNFIGVDSTGRGAAGNFFGVVIDANDSNASGRSASDNLVENNVISANFSHGVLIQAVNGVASNNVLDKDEIGVDILGGAFLPNGGAGVDIVGASGNTIGSGNTISGNLHNGVHIIGTLANPADGNSITGNQIGVDSEVSIVVPNHNDGINIDGATNTTITNNVIGGNHIGIELHNGAQNNAIQHNWIGFSPDGTTHLSNGTGIVLRSDANQSPPNGPGQPNEPGVRNNQIGGTSPGDGNTIASNYFAGIAIFGNPVSLSGQSNTGNAILGNSIYDNDSAGAPGSHVGIDLVANLFPYQDGFTANDSHGHGAPNDPNNFQNFPVITFAAIGPGGTHVRGSLTQSVSPNTTFRVELFADEPLPAFPGGVAGNAEGKVFLGFTNVTTDGSGQATFDLTLPVYTKAGQQITATATDPLGNTSEFSPGLRLMGVSGVADPGRYPTPISVGGSLGVVALEPYGPSVPPETLTVLTPFPGFTGEIRRAVGDLNGDGVPDFVLVAGPGTGPHVHIVDGSTLGTLANFEAFNPGFTGGVSVALADVNGDGILDLIVGAGAGGGPHVKVIDGTKVVGLFTNAEVPAADLLASFFAYDPAFAGGVTVTGADFNGDGHADVVTGTAGGGGPHVKVIDGTKLGDLLPGARIADSALLAGFYAYDPAFLSGVFLAAGDVNGDGVPDIVTGTGAGGGPHVKVIDGTRLNQRIPGGQIAPSALLGSFFAYDPAFTGGVRVDLMDDNGDGRLDVVTGAGPGGGPEVKAIDATKLHHLLGNAEIAPDALFADFDVDLSSPIGYPPPA